MHVEPDRIRPAKTIGLQQVQSLFENTASSCVIFASMTVNDGSI
jgi:hypothetical protein